MSKARDLANGATALSAVSATELGYLDGVTSAIQTQLNQKPEVVAGKNAVINGGMDIWQRGTSFALAASTSTYTADRWKCRRNATGATISRQATNDTTNLPFIQYALRAQRDSGNATTDLIQVTQSFENINSIPYAGKTLTISFYARAGANYSSSSNGLIINLKSGTISDGDVISNTFGNTIVGQTATLTTTWQRFTYTGTMVATDTAIGLQMYYTPSGTAGANDFFEVTGVQLEVGSTATPFSKNASTIQGELAACQRYYWRSVYGNGSANRLTVFGTCTTTTECRVNHLLPVQMRVAPTSVDYSSLRCYDGAGFPTITSLTLASSEPQVVEVVTVGTGYTTYRPTAIALNGNAGYIGFSAEL